MPIVADQAGSTPPPRDHVEMKVCTKCGEPKNRSDFFVKIKSTGRLFARCKICHTQQCRANESKNPGRQAERVRKWREKHPEKNKEIEVRFRTRHAAELAVKAKHYRESEAGRAVIAAREERDRDVRLAKRAEWRRINADRKKAADAAYREANREAITKRHRDWIEANTEAWAVICARAKHRRRDREAMTECTLTGDEWAEILRLQDNRCGRCRRKFTPHLKPHKDHIIPLSKGGGLTAQNTQSLCGKCNNEKFVDDTDYRGLLPGFF